MAPILLRAKYGASWTPTWPYQGTFSDVPSSHPLVLWIEQLARDQITAGCAQGLYCPGSPNTRGQMSVFLVRALSLAPAVTAYASNITYHPSGMIQQIAHGNGTAWNQTIPANGMARPGSIFTTGASQNWSSGNYLYDGAGNIAKIGADHYFYDAAGRLSLATADQSGGLSRRQRFGYDAYGNMTGMTTILNGVDPGTQGIGVNSTTNRLTAGSYDAAGNRLTTGTGQAYGWDGIGMMQSLTGSGQDWIYIYTADDERIWMLNRAASPDLGVWTVRDLDGSVLRQWVETGDYASDGIPVGSHSWTHDRDYVWRGGSLLASASSAGTRFFHLDHLGTPRLITDGSGAGERHDYWPFGEEITAPGTDRFKFTGHERDFSGGWGGAAASDLDYMHARSYAPLFGRFLSTDPIGGTLGNPQSFNRYAYVMGDPVNYVDPYGLFWMQAWKAMKGLLGIGDEKPEATFEMTIEVEAKTPTAEERASDAFLRSMNSPGNDWWYVSRGLNPPGGNAAGEELILLGPFALARQAFPVARTTSFFEGSSFVAPYKLDTFHTFPRSVMAFEKSGKIVKVVGQDGVKRQMLRIPGEYAGRPGHFEFMKDSAGNINHYFFRQQ